MKRQKRREIKAVAFDIGGVLQLGTYCRPKREHSCLGVHEYIAKKLKIKLDTWFDAIDTAYAQSIENKISRNKVIDIISKNLQITKHKLTHIVRESYLAHFKKNKELYKCAHDLKKNGIKIAILSDQWHLSDEALVPKADRKGFDVIIVSCEVGVRKPNPKIYKLLIKELRKKKIKPSEILFVDNREWNLKPAEKLKMQTLLFKNNKQAIKEIEQKVKV